MRHSDQKHDNIPPDRPESRDELTPLEALKRAWNNASDDEIAAFLKWLETSNG